MPAFAATFNIAGSFEADHISAWYRSPVELGWGNPSSSTTTSLGREALEVEKANPRRAIRTLVWNADDVVDVYASLFRPGSRTRSWTCRATSAGSCAPTRSAVTASSSASPPPAATATTSGEMLSLCTHRRRPL